MTAQPSLFDLPALRGVWTDYGDHPNSIASYLREHDKPNAHTAAWPELSAFRGIEARAEVHHGQKCLMVSWHADRPDCLYIQAGRHELIRGTRDDAREALRRMVAEAEAWVAKPLAEVVADRLAKLEAQLTAVEGDHYGAAQERYRLTREIAEHRALLARIGATP